MEQWYLYKKKANFNQIGEKFNIDPVIARLIRNRDVVGDEQIQQYLYGELSDISDPFLMKGVKEGVEILKQKVQEGKTIRIISDYDVDGVVSNYILWKAKKQWKTRLIRSLPVIMGLQQQMQLHTAKNMD